MEGTFNKLNDLELFDEMIMLFRGTRGENGSLTFKQAQTGNEMVPAGHRFQRMAALLDFTL